MTASMGSFSICSCSSEWGNAFRERLRSSLDGEVMFNMGIKWLNDDILCIYKFSFQFLSKEMKRSLRKFEEKAFLSQWRYSVAQRLKKKNKTEQVC